MHKPFCKFRIWFHLLMRYNSFHKYYFQNYARIISDGEKNTSNVRKTNAAQKYNFSCRCTQLYQKINY